VIRTTPVVLGTIGAVMGLRYLQKMWTQKKNNPNQLTHSIADSAGSE